jgi:hypothetical protein
MPPAHLAVWNGTGSGDMASQVPIPVDHSASEAFRAIANQPDAAAAVRVAASYGWNCEVIPTP